MSREAELREKIATLTRIFANDPEVAVVCGCGGSGVAS